MSQLQVAHAGLVHDFLELGLVLVGNLHDHARVLGQEYFHDVVVAELVQADFHAALHVGKTHFEQRGDQAAGGNVVPGQHQPLVHQRLHGIEGVAEVIRALAGRHVRADFVQRLRESRTAQTQFVKAEIYVVERALGLVHHHGRHDALHVAHLATRAHDDRARRNNLLSAGILLAHGK